MLLTKNTLYFLRFAAASSDCRVVHDNILCRVPHWDRYRDGHHGPRTTGECQQHRAHCGPGDCHRKLVVCRLLWNSWEGETEACSRTAPGYRSLLRVHLHGPPRSSGGQRFRWRGVIGCARDGGGENSVIDLTFSILYFILCMIDNNNNVISKYFKYTKTIFATRLYKYQVIFYLARLKIWFHFFCYKFSQLDPVTF